MRPRRSPCSQASASRSVWALASSSTSTSSAERIVEAVQRFADAGYTLLGLVQVGPEQDEFCDFYANQLGPALQAL
jgi:hypothetical protein